MEAEERIGVRWLGVSLGCSGVDVFVVGRLLGEKKVEEGGKVRNQEANSAVTKDSF